MPWFTGPSWAQVQGLDNIYRSTAEAQPAPAAAAPAPQAPAGGDYWAQLGSLLGMTPTTPQAQAYTPWWQQQQQRFADVVPGAGMSIPGAGAYMAQMQQAMAQRAQQQAQSPSGMFAGMPSMNVPSQQYRPGSNQGGRNSQPLLRADGSVIDAESYMRGDRPGMQGGQGQTPISRPERPQLAPPTTAARPQRPKPSASFGTPSTREGPTRPSIPGFSNFVY